MDWLHQPRPAIRTFAPKPVINFRDINPDYTLDNEPFVIDEIATIKAQIRHLLSTLKGSEPFEPTYGSLLPRRLYDAISPFTAFIIETDTIVAVSTWMQGIVQVLASARVTPLTTEEGYLIELPCITNKSNTAFLYTFEALR